MSEKQADDQKIREAYTAGFVNHATGSGYDNDTTKNLYQCTQEIAKTRQATADSLKEMTQNIQHTA